MKKAKVTFPLVPSLGPLVAHHLQVVSTKKENENLDKREPSGAHTLRIGTTGWFMKFIIN